MSGTMPSRPRKPRGSEFIEKATAQGKPLPLEVLLDSMWRFLDETQRLETSTNPDDTILARVARDRALRIAVVAAPYVHPRMAATTFVGNEDSGPSDVRREYRFERLTDADATRFLEAIAAGEMTIEQVDAELR
jgi:hypothetical protein